MCPQGIGMSSWGVWVLWARPRRGSGGEMARDAAELRPLGAVPLRPELQPRGGPHNGVLDPLEVYRARALAAELERDRSLRRRRADRAERSRLRALNRSLVGMLNVGLRCAGVP